MKGLINDLYLIIGVIALACFAFVLLALMSVSIKGLGWLSLILLAPVIFYTVAYHTPAARERRLQAARRARH